MAEEERFTTSDGVAHDFDTLALHAGQRPDPIAGVITARGSIWQ